MQSSAAISVSIKHSLNKSKSFGGVADLKTLWKYCFLLGVWMAEWFSSLKVVTPALISII